MFRTISKPTKALCSLQRSISTNYSRSMVTVSVPTNLATINSRSLPNHCNRVHNKFNFHSSSSRSFSESHDDFKPKRKGIPEGMEEVLSLIDKYVKENSVILFMKGTPQQPQCGFSLQTVRILNALGVEFSAINVLEYPALREGKITNYQLFYSLESHYYCNYKCNCNYNYSYRYCYNYNYNCIYRY